MYTRTHTHTQARTHTTKFSGHVVRFFFFAVFFSPLRHSCFDEKETIWCTYSLQHWWYTETSTVIAHNRDVTAPMHAHTQRFSVTWQAQSVSGWIEIHSLRSDPTFFFFTWSQGVWSWWGVVSHLRRLGPRNSATCVLLYHTSVSALYILLKECTTARTTSKHARTVNENNDGDGILHRDRMDNAYANAALEGTTLLDSSVFPPLTYNTRTWRQNVCT